MTHVSVVWQTQNTNLFLLYTDFNDEQATPTFTYQHGTQDSSLYLPLEHAFQIWWNSIQWSLRYTCVAFIAPPIGWAQHSLICRFPVLLWIYPPSFVMIGHRVWELWPIFSKPRPLRKYIGPWRLCFFDQSGSFITEIVFSFLEAIYQIWCW